MVMCEGGMGEVSYVGAEVSSVFMIMCGGGMGCVGVDVSYVCICVYLCLKTLFRTKKEKLYVHFPNIKY